MLNLFIPEKPQQEGPPLMKSTCPGSGKSFSTLSSSSDAPNSVVKIQSSAAPHFYITAIDKHQASRWLSLKASPAGSSYSIAHLVNETPVLLDMFALESLFINIHLST